MCGNHAESDSVASLTFAAHAAHRTELSMNPCSLFPALLLALLATGASTRASAEDYKIGNLQISQPWTRATPKGAAVAGGYLKITNTGTTPDRLLGGSTDVAKRVEVHEMSMEGGVMKMRELKNGLDIAPGATVELKPNSYHIMLQGLSRPLAKGERVKASLTFEKAGKGDVEFAVEAIGARAGGGEMKHNH
jgi:copper(I)-binding protein